MIENRNEIGELRACVVATIDDYLSLGVKLTPLQIFRELVTRGLLNDTTDDYDNLQLVMASAYGVGLPRQERLDRLKDAIREAGDRFERGEPDLLEDIEAILRRTLG